MDKKISFIKERVLQIAENKGIAKEKFIEDIGMTYGNFKGPQKKTALNSNALDKILSIHDDVDAYWLITGREKPKSYNIEEGNALNIAAEPGKDNLQARIKDLEQENKMLKGVINKFLGEDNGHNGKSAIG